LKRYRYIPWIGMCALALILAGAAGAQTPRKVLILPFQIHSEKDLSFLQKGIQDMLANRLGQEGVAQVLPQGEGQGAGTQDLKAVGSAGEKAGADYVVFGSVTVLGASISTDARVYDTAGKAVSLTFNDTGNDQGDVIDHIDRFSQQVIGQVFGLSPAGRPATTQATETPEGDDQSRKHPEALWTGKIESERGRTGEEGPAGSNLGDIWRSRSVKMEILAMALGDVDGDGLTETVYSDDRDVHVYRLAEDKFIKIGLVAGAVAERIVTLDVADINGNKRAEIFVTAVNTTSQAPVSYVLEWTDGRFERIVSRARVYFRVIQIPGSGAMLVGQAKGPKAPFSGRVEEMTWNGQDYTAGVPQPLPSGASVFSFNYGDVTGDGKPDTLAMSTAFYLNLISAEGEREWESAEDFGGTAVYLQYPSEGAAPIGEYKEQDKYYLPQRILIADVDQDGANEVLVSKNRDAAKGLFQRLRYFKGGSIQCLSFDNLGLHPEWRTREVSGYLSDYAIGDIDNDGRMEIAYAVVTRISSVISDARSLIAAQDMMPADAPAAPAPAPAN